MTDKFVVSTNEIGEIIVTDVETDRVYRYDDPSNFFGLIRLLNEQQATIDELEKNFDDLVKYASEIAKRNVVLDEQIGQLQIENEQLKQILKDIVVATDETYTKNRSIYKISVVFDNETYLKIRECLNE